MTRFRHKNVDSRMEKCCGGFLILMIVGSIMLGCFVTADLHSYAHTVLMNQNPNAKTLGCSFLDPVANLNGFHLNLTKANITTGGTDFTLFFPVDWDIVELGLNFFNGTLVQDTTTGTSTARNFMTYIDSEYRGLINLDVPGNSTIYQAQFNTTGMEVGETSAWTTPNGLSNSSYPTIDGNVGIAQNFSISNHACNLTIQVRLMRIEGTARNLTVEVRSSTSDNRVGGLLKTASFAPTTIGTGSEWVSLAVPNVSLSPGKYFIVLHTDKWLRSGGGYLAETTLSKRATSPSPGWVSFDRGVNWGNLVNLTNVSSYYFNGFKLRVRATPQPTPSNPNLRIPSDLNLKINGFQVADNFIWNQSAGSSGTPPYSFKITSDYPISVLNFTYKLWIYRYGTNNLLNKLYRIVVNGYKNTTAITEKRDFSMMYVNLNRTELLRHGPINPSNVTLNLRLFSNNTAVGGILNVTSWVWITTSKTGISFSNPYSLKLAFNYTLSGGPYDNVSFAETAMAIGPINSQIDNLFINGTRIDRKLWSHTLGRNYNYTYIYRQAFTMIPQFTLVSSSLLNITLTTLNNFTASVNTAIIDHRLDPDGPSPIASVHVNSSVPLLDLDGLSQVNITVANPGGDIINNSILTPIEGPYVFDWILTEGAGIYGLKITSKDVYGDVATRWIGAATVDDFVLAPPKVILTAMNGTVLIGNLTSGQNILILANISYIDHPTWNFSGAVNVTVYLGGTGEVYHLAATWNATTRTYSATYDPPSVDSPTPLTIYVEAVDLKGRISTNSTFTYLLPHSAPPIPQGQPSIMAILELLIIALITLIPVVAYIAEKRRKA